MQEIISVIDNQLKESRGKNIFYEIPGLLSFNNDTIRSISELKSISSDVCKLLIEHTTNKAIEEFCRVNQYFAFNSESRSDLQEVYADLLSAIHEKKLSVEQISEKHYLQLKKWVTKHNAFAEKMYSREEEKLDVVPCSEYDPEFQLQILGIADIELLSPILDIGCGQSGNLVNYLNDKGYTAFGIDRYSFTSQNLAQADWLEYNYGDQQWGTIISNLGFSNHFRHHNLRNDGDFVTYAKTFMNILQSLRLGGSFFYAPDLPFVEKYLDKTQYTLFKNTLSDSNFMSAQIKKVSICK
jgi:hypothetical protein